MGVLDNNNKEVSYLYFFELWDIGFEYGNKA